MPKYNANARHNLRLKLAWSWLKHQRPDVVLAIEEEVNKQIPHTKPQRKLAALPKSLQQMK